MLMLVRVLPPRLAPACLQILGGVVELRRCRFALPARAADAGGVHTRGAELRVLECSSESGGPVRFAALEGARVFVYRSSDVQIRWQ